MENTNKFRVTKSFLHKTQLGIVLLGLIFLGILFYTEKKPEDFNLPFTALDKPKFSHFIYGGFGADQLWKPMAVTTIADLVFVSDTNNHRIQSFTKEGTPLNIFGSRGYEKGQFQFPYGLVGDDKGRLLVADLYLGRISIFDLDGNFIEYFGEKEGINQIIAAPSAITFWEGKLYVADVKKKRVFVFDNRGRLVLEIGQEFEELGAPNGVAVDHSTGEVYVVDSKDERVIVYDNKGTVLGQFDGNKESQEGIFSNPRGIGIDKRGVIYVVSSMSNLIYGFNEKAENLFSLGGKGSGQEQFNLPNGLHIDEANYVYVTDTINNRIVVYRPSP